MMGKAGKKITQEQGGSGSQPNSNHDRQNNRSNNMEENTTGSSSVLSSNLNRTISTPAHSIMHSSHLSAAVSSPSLLSGCANSETHAGAEVERHFQTHNIQVVNTAESSDTPESPLAPTNSNPTPAPFTFPTSSDIPDSVFLTPAQSERRLRGSHHDRPNSAPTHHLERISGTLLRLVGDHYLCCTCGRQLRTIGDELTMETTLNHITRAISSGQLDLNQSGN